VNLVFSLKRLHLKLHLSFQFVTLASLFWCRVRLSSFNHCILYHIWS